MMIIGLKIGNNYDMGLYLYTLQRYNFLKNTKHYLTNRSNATAM